MTFANRIIVVSFFRLLADEILLIFKQHPSLVVDYSNELIEFVNGMKSLEIGLESFFSNLVRGPFLVPRFLPSFLPS